MAKIAIIKDKPSKLKWSNGIKPVMMSQKPSRINPRFFVSLNLLILLTSFFVSYCSAPISYWMARLIRSSSGGADLSQVIFFNIANPLKPIASDTIPIIKTAGFAMIYELFLVIPKIMQKIPVWIMRIPPNINIHTQVKK